jgi:valyl-tRNA synthetase
MDNTEHIMEQTEINMYKDMIRKIQAELQAEIITIEEERYILLDRIITLEEERSSLLEIIKKQKEQINNQAKMLSDPMFVRSNEPYYVETEMQPKKTKYFEVDYWGSSYKVVASDNTGDI